jgi:ABC transporter transmembrane region/ABC transporter
MTSTLGLLASLYYLYPAAVFVYFVVAETHSVFTLQSLKAAKNEKEKRFPHRPLSILFLLFVLTYIIEFLSFGAFCISQRRWIEIDDNVAIGLISCFLVFALQYASFKESDQPVCYPYYASWLLALTFEPAVATLAILTNQFKNPPYLERTVIAISALRYLLLILLTGYYFAHQFTSRASPSSDEERQSLLPEVATACRRGSQGSYGSTLQEEGVEQEQNESLEYPWEERERKAREQMEKKLLEEGNWLTYVKRFKVRLRQPSHSSPTLTSRQLFWPYIWPVGNRSLQLRLSLVGLCLLAENALNLLVPRQIALIVDSLTGADDYNPWVELAIFAGLKIVASDAGIELFRQWLWIPVEMYSYEAMSTAAYSHILDLSADFHDSKSSSDIMMAIQGGQGISNMVEQFCFYAAPMLIDLIVASVYLSVTFGPYEGLITITTGTLFLYMATRMISSMKDVRRSQVSACYEEHYVRQAGIQGWQTVAAFNQAGYEYNRYSNAVKNRITTTQDIYLAWYKTHGFQSATLLFGLLAGAALAVHQIKAGNSSPGQFAMLLMYWAQLTSPLIFFAHLGKNISNDFIQAERLLEIMLTKPSVLNKKNARPLKFFDGTVEFTNVCFSYDKKKRILDNITFTAPGGVTVAFVGATGAGKSTILKLLNRFYDATEGSICIDGQDVRDIDLPR